MSDEFPTSRYRQATNSILGGLFVNRPYFIAEATSFLSSRHGDLHLEYHTATGWQVSTCYSAGVWSDDGWLSGDGSLHSALLVALEKAVETAEL